MFANGRYVINYSPFDVVYKLCKFAPVRLLARVIDQVHVTHHIHHGVNYALKHYTAAYLIAVLVGIAKGINRTDLCQYLFFFSVCPVSAGMISWMTLKLVM